MTKRKETERGTILSTTLLTLDTLSSSLLLLHNKSRLKKRCDKIYVTSPYESKLRVRLKLFPVTMFNQLAFSNS